MSSTSRPIEAINEEHRKAGKISASSANEIAGTIASINELTELGEWLCDPGNFSVPLNEASLQTISELFLRIRRLTSVGA